jgi:GABA(A) receptor-associated protein
MNTFDFKTQYSFDHRFEEAQRIRRKYPNRIPVICEKDCNADISTIDKNKFLIPDSLTVGQFSCVIRKRLKLRPETAMFIMVKDTLPSISTKILSLYEKYKDDDGFLYVKYKGEDIFG